MGGVDGAVALQSTIPVWGWGGIVTAAIAIAAALLGIGNWYGSVNSDRTAFKTFMSEIKDDIGAIRNNIKLIFERLPHPFVRSSSPVTLTESGKEVSASLGVKAWAEEQAPRLKNEVEGKEEFEIFAKCAEHAQEQYEKDEALRRKVDGGAYQRGSEAKEILKIYTVELRDAVLRRP